MEINYDDLESRAFPGAFSTYDMEVLVPEVMKIPNGGVYLEVGVDKGKSLSIAYMVKQIGVRAYGVDLRSDPMVPNTIFYQGDSVAIAKFFHGGKIDVLFIDGDHSYLGCKRDIDAWFPHMKSDGVMLFHDCDETSPGVIQAVAEFVNNYKGTLKEFTLCKRTDKNTSMARIRL